MLHEQALTLPARRHLRTHVPSPHKRERERERETAPTNNCGERRARTAAGLWHRAHRAMWLVRLGNAPSDLTSN